MRDACATLAGREEDDAPAAAPRLASAALAAVLTGDTDTAVTLAGRGAAAAGGVDDPAVRAQARTSQALAGVLAADPRLARDAVTRLRDEVAALPAGSPAAISIAVYALAAVYCEDFGVAGAEIGRAVEGLRAAGMASSVPFPLTVAAEAGLRTGRWTRALADAQEALALTDEGGQECLAAYALCILARLRAGQGRRAGCERDARRALAIGERTRSSVPRIQALHALGLLALGCARLDDAHGHLAELAALESGYGTGNPVPVPWRPDMVETCVRLGRREEARAQLVVLVDEASRCGGRWAAGAVSRCRGLLARDGYEAHFRDALVAHGDAGMPFELARTRLAFGERLRRDRRRAEARVHLAAALEDFDALGARPWGARAREELEASGLTSRRGDGPEADRLTPREQQVATAVAEGATNREAAARLFLSEKTIERHLGSVYRKLGLRSRSQLARRFAVTVGVPDRD
jgi:DNA-binding CsgD family transcriptional regulator